MAFPKGANLFTSLSRRLYHSSTAIATNPNKRPKFRCTNGIPHQYKSRAIEEAQKALREHFHTTKSLPFAFSELIATNSPFSLSNLVRNVFFSTKTFSASLRKLLRYEPINDFEFFLESIGIDHRNVLRLLPRTKFSFSEDSSALVAAFSLSQFGFPWNSLGKLYEEDVLIFSKRPDELSDRLGLLKERSGLGNLSVVGICLVFPNLLSSEGDLSCDIDHFVGDLKRVFVELDNGSCFEGNLDSWYEVCHKVRIFYDLGCDKAKVGKLMCRSKYYFSECSKENLTQKVEYFGKFDVGKVDVGLLLLRSPEILKLDLETPVISVLRFLEHFGLNSSGLQCVSQKYPHVLGRNKMANLPQVMKALNLHKWLFNKIKSSKGRLLATYNVCCLDDDSDREFADSMKKIESSRLARHTMGKVDFLKGIGFGENALTLKVLNDLHGTSSDLEERFDSLLRAQIKHSKLCLIINAAPKILSQSTDKLEKKLEFWCRDMGYSVEYLDDFPQYLTYDLENRIKRRYRCYNWLRENAFRNKDYSIRSLITLSEKRFVEFLYGIHPATPKHYFEFFYNQRPISSCRGQVSSNSYVTISLSE